jgi:hypothetical protein
MLRVSFCCSHSSVVEAVENCEKIMLPRRNTVMATTCYTKNRGAIVHLADTVSGVICGSKMERAVHPPWFGGSPAIWLAAP